jgi:hypothetical protein
MTRRFAFSVLPMFGILFCAASLAAAAEDYFRLVPEKALGFWVINQPAEVDAKIQSVSGEMKLPVPPLVDLFKMKAGIQEGLDEKGPIVFVALPDEKNGVIPVPILLIPVTDYAKFRDQLSPESTTDEVTEVKFFNEATLIRNIGGYAALTGAPFREGLESLQLAGEVPSALKPLAQWASSRDAALVIFQPGIKELSSKGQAWLNTMKMMFGQAGEQGKQISAGFTMYGKMLQAIEKEVTAFGIGAGLDKQNVLRITSCTELKPGGNWATALAQSTTPKENLLTGLPSDPYVVAGGAALNDALTDAMSKLSINMMKDMPEVYGLTEEQTAKLSENLAPKLKGLQSMSMSLGVGKGDEPLYANLLGVMRVENATTFMAGYEKYFVGYNEMVKGAKSPLIQPMEVEKCEVAGTPALQVTMSIPKPPGPMPPQYNKMIETMLGPGNKLVFWLAPADDNTVVMGYVKKEPMERMIASLKQKAKGLAENADLAKTAALLPPDAPMVAYLSPQGAIELVKRMVAVILPAGMQDRVAIPDFPQSPPLGFAIKTAPNEVETTLAVPAEVLKAIGQYIQHIRGMSGEDVTMK